MQFIVTETIKMRDIRQAESSNSAAMELMSKHAYDDNGRKLEQAQAIAVMDDLDMTEFAQLYVKFIQSAIPKASARP